jgi:hypothetical protein
MVFQRPEVNTPPRLHMYRRVKHASRFGTEKVCFVYLEVLILSCFILFLNNTFCFVFVYDDLRYKFCGVVSYDAV